MKLKKKLLAFFVSCFLFSSILSVLGDLEDFQAPGNYVEVDPGGDITIHNSTRIDAQIWRNSEMYAYSDKGASFFVNFTHTFKVKVNSSLTANDLGLVWLLANNTDDWKGLRDASYTTLSLDFFNAAGSLQMRLGYFNGAALIKDTYAYSYIQDQWYWLNITREGTTLTAKIYLDEYLNLNDTLTVSSGAYAYQYYFPIQTFNDAKANDVKVTVQNVDLGIAAPDLYSPTITYLGLNSTLNNQTGLFTFNLTDNVGLSHLVFSWNNSGTMVNHTSAISGTNIIANYSGTINETIGYIVEYRAFFNDTSDNWGSTLMHYFEVNDPVKAVDFLGYLILAPIFLISVVAFIYWASRKH